MGGKDTLILRGYNCSGLEFNLVLERFSQYSSTSSFSSIKGGVHFFEWFFWPVPEVSWGLVGPKGAGKPQRKCFLFLKGASWPSRLEPGTWPWSPPCFPELSGDWEHRRKMACFLSQLAVRVSEQQGLFPQPAPARWGLPRREAHSEVGQKGRGPLGSEGLLTAQLKCVSILNKINFTKVLCPLKIALFVWMGMNCLLSSQSSPCPSENSHLRNRLSLCCFRGDIGGIGQEVARRHRGTFWSLFCIHVTLLLLQLSGEGCGAGMLDSMFKTFAVCQCLFFFSGCVFKNKRIFKCNEKLKCSITILTDMK